MAAEVRARSCAGFPNPIELLLSSKPWVAAAFAVLSFVLGVVWFVVLATAIATSLSMLIMVFGVPMLVFTMWVWTLGARSERWRVNAFFGTRIGSPYRPLTGDSWLLKVRAFVTDPAVWRDLAYLLVLFPIGILELVIVTVAVSVPIGLLVHPFWHWADAILGNDHTAHSLPEAIGLGLLGIPLFLLMPYVLVGTGKAHVLLARALLGGNREAELEERVDELTVSRSRMMEAALVERRRIERDLHDGAQQRLVALAMDLGMARIKLESDPEGAKKLVDEAHREAKLAMAEIRNLVQGIHPAVLSDRGLDAAISALAGRCPVPVGVIVDLDGRLPDAVESTAYFVVAESLTNVAKHSVATEAQVRVFLDGSRLVVEVSDNGVGGADADGAGLTGLTARVAALDGRLTVESPPGGGTRIRAEIPCGS